MTMFTAADHQARVLRRRLLYTVLGIVLVVAAVVIGVTGIGVHRDPSTQTPAGTDPSTAAPTVTVTQQPPAGAWRVPPVSAGPLVLPAPTGTVRGVPVGFPHTVPGAISAAARYAETAIGLDETRARTVGEVAGAPSYPAAADDLAYGVQVAVASLGLPPDVGAGGAYLAFQARAYRVTDVKEARAVVQLLGVAEAAGPATAGQGRRAVTVTGYTMVWADRDWKIAGDTNLADPEPLPAPGSAQAYQGGWRDLALA
jgi:hypothetical protein